MASVIELNGKMEINSLAADWDYRISRPSSWPANPRLNCIVFVPGASGDELIILEQGPGNLQAVHLVASGDIEPRIQYFHGSRCMPYIDYAASTLSAGHKILVHLWRD